MDHQPSRCASQLHGAPVPLPAVMLRRVALLPPTGQSSTPLMAGAGLNLGTRVQAENSLTCALNMQDRRPRALSLGPPFPPPAHPATRTWSRTAGLHSARPSIRRPQPANAMSASMSMLLHTGRWSRHCATRGRAELAPQSPPGGLLSLTQHSTPYVAM